jgi:hypothetical protein
MDLPTTYKIFLVKTLKEKSYYWARNVFFVLFPLLFIVLTIFTGTVDEATKQHNELGRSYPPTTEVRVHTLHAMCAKNKQKF